METTEKKTLSDKVRTQYFGNPSYAKEDVKQAIKEFKYFCMGIIGKLESDPEFPMANAVNREAKELFGKRLIK